MSYLKKLTTIFSIAIISTSAILAQAPEKNDAINAYNAGIGLMKAANAAAAIDSLEYAVKVCETIGDSATELKNKILMVIPGAYLDKASKLLTDKKVPESILACKTALAIAEKNENTKAKERAQKVIVSAYFTLGNTLFSSKEFDKALLAYDSCLQINENYNKAILNKALVYSKMENIAKYGETLEAYFEKSKSIGDTAQFATARKQALSFYKQAGIGAVKANKLADAATNFNLAFKYGVDIDIYYRLADVLNKQKKFADAEVNAQKGLDLETGAPEAKAKFYYVLAEAKVGKGELDKACEAFKNAQFGPFVEAAKAQIKNNKCK
jgi:tetratricopeptide (TPR) repeat protein